MAFQVGGWRTRFKLDAKQHWLSLSANKFDTVVVATPIMRGTRGCELRTLFAGVNSKTKVKKFIEKVSKHEVDFLVSSDAGVLAIVECKQKDLFEDRISKIPGKISIVARPEEIDITIDSVHELEWDELANTFAALPDLRLKHGPHIMRVSIPLDEFVEMPEETYDSRQLDELDFKIARTLLESGYFKVPRPKGVTLNALASKIGTSKPSLILRMRKLQAFGIQNLLGLRRLSSEDLRVAAEVFRKKLLKK
jgi:predicted DNA binding protein